MWTKKYPRFWAVREHFRVAYARNNRRLREAGVDEEEDLGHAAYKKLSRPEEELGKFEKKILAFFPEREVKAAYDKWQPIDKNLKGDQKIIRAARGGDRSAQVYLWADKVRDVISSSMKAFFGPDHKQWARRINNGEFYDYIALAWGVLTFGNPDLLGDTGMLGTNVEKNKGRVGFDADKYTYGTVWKQFRNQYRNLLRNACIAYNNAAKLGGMAGLKGSIARGTLGADQDIHMQSYDAQFDDAAALADDSGGGQSNKSGGTNAVGLGSSVEDEFMEGEDRSEFLSKWKQFVQDAEMSADVGGVTPLEALKAAMDDSGATMTSLSKKAGASPQKIKAAMEEARSIMEGKYDISAQDFMTMLQKIGPQDLTSYMSLGGASAKASVEAKKSEPAKKEAPKSSGKKPTEKSAPKKAEPKTSKKEPAKKSTTKKEAPKSEEKPKRTRAKPKTGGMSAEDLAAKKKAYAQQYYEKLKAAGKIAPKKKKS
jgi:hypothetical protein